MVFFESEVEYKEYTSDAIGFPINPYNDYNNCVEREDNENSGKYLRPWMFEASKAIVIVVDLLNTVLDIILVVNLVLMGEHGYAVLLGFTTSLSLAVSIWMKYLMYRLRKDQFIVRESILQFLLITELFIFAFENATTILILTRVDEDGEFLVDHSEIFGASLNLWTTILSGVCVGLLLLINILMTLHEKPPMRYGILIAIPSIAGISYICYMLYFAIDKVLLENPMKDTEENDLKWLHVASMVLFSLLLLLQNIMANFIYMFGGGN